MAPFWRAEWESGVESVIWIPRTERNSPIIRKSEALIWLIGKIKCDLKRSGFESEGSRILITDEF